MPSEPFLTIGLILVIALVGSLLVKLEDRLREWWKWARGPGWIERKAKRRSKPSKEEPR